MASPSITVAHAPDIAAPPRRPAAPRLPALATRVFPRGATLAILDGAGLRLRVLAGEVWVTEERSLVDLVIGAGESCPLTRPGAALVAVHSRARLALEPDVPGATARVVRAKLTRTGPWVLLHRRAPLLARIGAALDHALAHVARRIVRTVLRAMIGARSRRVLRVRD